MKTTKAERDAYASVTHSADAGRADTLRRILDDIDMLERLICRINACDRVSNECELGDVPWFPDPSVIPDGRVYLDAPGDLCEAIHDATLTDIDRAPISKMKRTP